MFKSHSYSIEEFTSPKKTQLLQMHVSNNGDGSLYNYFAVLL